jgi:predicted site-specific integrase-resolvase
MMMEIPIEITAAAKQLGIARQSLHEYAKDGRLPVYWIGRMRVIDPKVWQNWKARYFRGEFDERGKWSR